MILNKYEILNYRLIKELAFMMEMYLKRECTNLNINFHDSERNLMFCKHDIFLSRNYLLRNDIVRYLCVLWKNFIIPKNG